MKTVITSEYEALFRQHFRLATLYAERIVGSAHEAEDIVQEVFIALLDVDFSQIRQKESYLYRCVRNAALDHLHARMKNRFYDINSKETVRLAAEENAPGDEQAMIEQIAAIYRRIEALPEQGRRIFKMICIEHKSYVETARLLSLSLHTVKTHMSRSFKALRKITINSRHRNPPPPKFIPSVAFSRLLSRTRDRTLYSHTRGRHVNPKNESFKIGFSRPLIHPVAP